MSKQTLSTIVNRHQVYLEGLKSQLVTDFDKVHADIEKRIKSALGELEVDSLDKLSKAELSATLTALRNTQQEVQLAALQGLTGKLQEAAGFSAKFEHGILSSVLKAGKAETKATAVTAAKAFQRALDQPVAGGVLLKPFMESWSKSQLDTVQGIVRDGWAQGKTVQQAVREVIGTKAQLYKDGVINTSRREAAAMVRTSTQHIAQTARMATWSENGDLIKGYEILATLDSKTTTICRAMDGREFEIGKGPVPPLHVNCRSTTIPVLGPEWDFLDAGATRSAEFGPVDGKLSYYDWLKKQDPEFINDVLGPSRAKLLMSGELTSQQFADLSLGKNFAPLTLEQMAAKNPYVFKGTGLDKFIPEGAFERAAKEAAEQAAQVAQAAKEAAEQATKEAADKLAAEQAKLAAEQAKLAADKAAFALKMQEAKKAAAAAKLAAETAAKEAADKLAAEQAKIAAEKAEFAKKMQEAKAAVAVKKAKTQELIDHVSANKKLTQEHLDLLDSFNPKEKQAYKDAVEAQVTANKAAFAKKMQDAKAAAAVKKAAAGPVPPPAKAGVMSQQDMLDALGFKGFTKHPNGEVSLITNTKTYYQQWFKSKADMDVFLQAELAKKAAGAAPSPVTKAVATPAKAAQKKPTLAEAKQTTGLSTGSAQSNGKVYVYDANGSSVGHFMNKSHAHDYIQSKAAGKVPTLDEAKAATGLKVVPYGGKAQVYDHTGSLVIGLDDVDKANAFVMKKAGWDATPAPSGVIATPKSAADFDHNVKVLQTKLPANSILHAPGTLSGYANKPYAELKNVLSGAEYDYAVAVKEAAKNKLGIAPGPISQVSPTASSYKPQSGYTSYGSNAGVAKHTHKKVEYKSVTKSTFDQHWPAHQGTQAQNSAVTKYTGSSYGSINAQLRTGAGTSQTSTIRSIREWFDSAPPVKDNLMTFRGIHLNSSTPWDTLFKPGQKYVDKAFISSSAVEGSNFGGYKLKILVPKDSKGVAKVKHLSHYASEDEVLFNSGTFEVIESNSQGATLLYLGPAK